MVSMPVNKMPKPIRIWPMLRFDGFLKNTNKMAPAKATMGAKVEGLSICRIRLSPEISAMRMIWPVTVVPMLAPMMTPTAWGSSMMPELTRPMTMTMVPAEDWMSAVMSVPSKTPRSVEAVSFCRMVCILPLASFSRPEPMMLMP